MTRSRALLIEVEVELEEVDHVQSMDKVLRLWMLRVEVVEEVDLAQSIDKAEMLFPVVSGKFNVGRTPGTSFLVSFRFGATSAKES